MTCIYNGDCGQCTMFDKDENEGQNYKNSEFGFSVEVIGECAVDEDPNPGNSCSMYESVNGSDDECECENLGSQCDTCDDVD